MRFAGFYALRSMADDKKKYDQGYGRCPTFTSLTVHFTATGLKLPLKYVGITQQPRWQFDLPVLAQDEWSGALSSRAVYGCQTDKAFGLAEIARDGVSDKDEDFSVPFQLVTDMGRTLDACGSFCLFDTYFSSAWNHDMRVAELCPGGYVRVEMPMLDYKTGKIPLTIARNEHGIRQTEKKKQTSNFFQRMHPRIRLLVLGFLHRKDIAASYSRLCTIAVEEGRRALVSKPLTLVFPCEDEARTGWKRDHNLWPIRYSWPDFWEPDSKWHHFQCEKGLTTVLIPESVGVRFRAFRLRLYSGYEAPLVKVGVRPMRSLSATLSVASGMMQLTDVMPKQNSMAEAGDQGVENGIVKEPFAGIWRQGRRGDAALLSYDKFDMSDNSIVVTGLTSPTVHVTDKKHHWETPLYQEQSIETHEWCFREHWELRPSPMNPREPCMMLCHSLRDKLDGPIVFVPMTFVPAPVPPDRPASPNEGDDEDEFRMLS